MGEAACGLTSLRTEDRISHFGNGPMRPTWSPDSESRDHAEAAMAEGAKSAQSASSEPLPRALVAPVRRIAADRERISNTSIRKLDMY